MKITATYVHLFIVFILIADSKASGQWTESTGLVGYETSVTSVVLSGSNLIAGTDAGIIYLSSDSGATWDSITTIAQAWVCPDCNIAMLPWIALFADSGYVLAGIGNVPNGGVFISSDGGLHWTDKDTGFTQSANCFASIGGTVFAGTNDGVYSSGNNGINWNACNNGLSYSNYDSIYGHAPQVVRLHAVGKNLFAGTTGEGIFRSTDEGTSWSEVDSGLNSLDIYGLASIGTSIFASAFITGGGSGGVFVSTNNGTNWNEMDSGITNHMINSLYVFDSDLFACTNIDLFLSTNGGLSWKDVTAGTNLDSSGFNFINVVGRYIVANGLWRCQLSNIITGIKPPLVSSPSEFELDQNYPNPFNPSTTINFTLPEESRVNLTIYDILGRQMTELVNGKLSAGYYSVLWNAANFASGVYFYRLRAGNFVETKKLLLMK